MRHGQGFHSSAVTPNGHLLPDPHLTPKGQEQCLARRQEFGDQSKIELLLASPLRRALESCHLTFAPCVARGLKIIALPMAEEATADPCDTGSPVEDLRKEFPPETVDFNHVRIGWYLHENEYAVDPVSLAARAAKLRRFVRDREEREVVLVGHGFFNHYLTGNVDAQGRQTTGWWGEAEVRSFRFVEGSEGAEIVEVGGRKGEGTSGVVGVGGMGR
ncbi:hypothetical protein LTR62_001214 [Meristemomyces frigidus]|uniref:Phosphoglycerate mutase-like protein n=1 Tax=Meristemomyces frigidus TaxID=1508187 RepID=A0AAN7TGC9_9PEZI|nr:hypothetical protein LTR62_001214 [Meristemomyces frigidus]